jgi:hypothetical protein
LATDVKIWQAHLNKGVAWKLPVAAFDLLQAQDVWAVFFNKALHQGCTQADGIDVPSGD